MFGIANLCYQIDQQKMPVRMIALKFPFAKFRITLNSFCSRERNLKKRKGKNTEDMMILFPLQSVDHVLPLTLYGTFIAREISLKCRKKLRPCTWFSKEILKLDQFLVKYFYSIEKVRKTFHQIHFGQFTFGNRIDQKRVHKTWIL